MGSQLQSGDACGARTRRGTACRQPKGKNTDHLGQGRCWLHGGATPIKHGRYSNIRRPRIRELAEQFENDSEPLDLEPELAQARALYANYMERVGALDVGLAAQPAKDRGNCDSLRSMPATCLEPHEGMGLLSEITKIVKRIEDIRAKKAVSRADFFRVLTEVGRVVDKHVESDGVKERIREDWLEIRLT